MDKHQTDTDTSPWVEHKPSPVHFGRWAEALHQMEHLELEVTGKAGEAFSYKSLLFDYPTITDL